jgi:hypothetical protein
VPHLLERRTTDPAVFSNRAEFSYFAAGDGDGECLARFDPAQHLADLVPKVPLRDGGGHCTILAILLNGYLTLTLPGTGAPRH